MLGNFFKGGKLPDFEDIFETASRNLCEIMELYDHSPRLDDSGDDMNSVIDHIHWLWDMHFTCDGWVDDDVLFGYFADYIQSYLPNSPDNPNYPQCADDIRSTFLNPAFEEWLVDQPIIESKEHKALVEKLERESVPLDEL